MFLPTVRNEAKNGGGGNRTRVTSPQKRRIEAKPPSVWLDLVPVHHFDWGRYFGYVYFIQQGDGGPIKIGLSRRPERRLRALQASNPETLYPLFLTAADDAYALEQDLHKKFREHRVSGEWFEPEPVLNYLDLAWADQLARDGMLEWHRHELAGAFARFGASPNRSARWGSAAPHRADVARPNSRESDTTKEAAQHV